jgi:hypothetical protein
MVVLIIAQQGGIVMGQITTLLTWEMNTVRSSLPFPDWMEETITPEPNLWQLNQEIAAMEQQRGVTAQKFFRKILSDKLILRHPNGKVIGKIEFLKTLLSPSLFTDYEIEMLEEIPLLRSRHQVLVTLLVRTQDRYATVRHFRHIRLFTRTRIGWKLEFWYNYEDLCA